MPDITAIEDWRVAHWSDPETRSSVSLANEFHHLTRTLGLNVPEWPQKRGGYKGTPTERLQWYQYCLQYELPPADIVGVEIAGPLLMLADGHRHAESLINDIAHRHTIWGYSTNRHDNFTVISPAGRPELTLQLLDAADDSEDFVTIQVVSGHPISIGAGTYRIAVPNTELSFVASRSHAHAQLSLFRALPLTARVQQAVQQLVALQSSTESPASLELTGIKVDVEALVGTALRCATRNDTLLAGAVARLQERICWQCFFAQQSLQGYDRLQPDQAPGTNEPRPMSNLLQSLAVLEDSAFIRDELLLSVSPEANEPTGPQESP